MLIILTWAGRWGWCTYVADEHYVPTLLAALGKENETDCLGGLTSVDWYRMAEGGHPWAYPPAEINKTLYAPMVPLGNMHDVIAYSGRKRCSCSCITSCLRAGAVQHH